MAHSYLVSQARASRKTPQNKPIPGSNQVANSAGGYSWAVDDFQRLERFLILGSESNTYYTSSRKLTEENVDAVRRAIAEDGQRVVKMVVDVSSSGRAAKNDPALFVLAMCASAKDDKTRMAALSALPKVARIGTHLFHFAEFIDGMRGWGPALRRAVSDWYLERHAASVAHQVVKYQQRDGWSHRDLIRLAHPDPTGKPAHGEIFKYVTGGADVPKCEEAAYIRYFEEAKAASDEATIVRLIRDHGLVREAIPTQFQKSKAVWDALLVDMPMTAMLRNLGRMGAVGLLTPMSDASRTVVSKLSDSDALRKSRVHPIQVLAALITYGSGAGVRGSLSWTVVPQVKDALDSTFYAAFDNVEPTGKNFYLGIDVSGSMGWGEVQAIPGLAPSIAAAAMAMVTARTEQNYFIGGFASSFRDLGITAKDTIDSALRKTSGMTFGGTNCAIPIEHALANKVPAEIFVTYSDGETWAGRWHVSQALVEYRQKTGIPAKLINVAMVPNAYGSSDPTDPGSLEVVGFDTNVPEIMRNFALST